MAQIMRLSASWDDLQIIVSSAKLPAVDAPTWTTYKSSEVLAFKKDATNTIAFSVQLPHNWLQGSDISFHLHLTYPATHAGQNSVWQMTHAWANIGSAFPAQTTPTKTTILSAAVDVHQIASIATLTGSGKTLSSIILCSLSRLGNDAADDYDDYVYLVGADFHHQVDSLGSITEYYK